MWHQPNEMEAGLPLTLAAASLRSRSPLVSAFALYRLSLPSGKRRFKRGSSVTLRAHGVRCSAGEGGGGEGTVL